jgi:hypothetical protein
VVGVRRTNKNQKRRKIMKSSKLPIQAAPVERTITGTRISSQNGVEASGWLDILKSVGQAALPVVNNLLG